MDRAPRNFNAVKGRQGPPVADRVGGGMQRSAADDDNWSHWTVLPGCDLCWVHFTNGEVDCACDCIAAMLDSDHDGP